MGTPAYYYSSTAGSYTITGSLTSSATSVTLNSVTGLPSSAPFKMVLDPGQVSEEIVKVTSVAGTTLSVQRGWDGTSAASHAAGAAARHMMTAEDLTLSRSHEAATSAHGVTGNVVGTSDTQALTNKDLSDATNVFPASLATLTGAQALTHKDLTDASNTFPSSLVTLSGTQTLANKTLASPVFTGSPSGAPWTPVQTTFSTYQNNFTYASGTSDNPVGVKVGGVFTITGRIRQTAGFTGGVAFNVGANNAPVVDGSNFSLPVGTVNPSHTQGPRITATVSSTGDVSFALADSSTQPAAWGSGTWISFMLTWVTSSLT